MPAGKNPPLTPIGLLGSILPSMLQSCGTSTFRQANQHTGGDVRGSGLRRCSSCQWPSYSTPFLLRLPPVTLWPSECQDWLQCGVGAGRKSRLRHVCGGSDRAGVCSRGFGGAQVASALDRKGWWSNSGASGNPLFGGRRHFLRRRFAETLETAVGVL